jgi:hypothetical protein
VDAHASPSQRREALLDRRLHPRLSGENRPHSLGHNHNLPRTTKVSRVFGLAWLDALALHTVRPMDIFATIDRTRRP